MDDRALLQQALEKLEFFAHMKGVSEDTARLIAALRERLAQPERIQLTVRDFVVTVGGIEDAVGTPTYWAEWPTTGNVLMDAYHAMQEKKQAARTTDRGPVAWLPPDPPPECKSEAEKTAFAFGWFKALEAQRAAKEEAIYETIIQWDEGGGKRSRRELARRIVALYANTGDTP